MDSSDVYRQPIATGKVDLDDDPSSNPGRDQEPSSLSRLCRRGIAIGFKYTFYLVFPLLLIVTTAILIPTAIGLGSGRGFAIPDELYKGLAGYALFMAWGSFAGLLGGVMTYLVRKIRPRRAKSDGSIAAEPKSVSRRRSRRWLWIGLATLPTQVVLLTALGIGSYLGRDVDRRIKAATAEADADDPHWRLDDLLANRVFVPDEENSALVVNEIVGELPEDYLAAPRPGEEKAVSPYEEVYSAYERVGNTPDNVQLDEGTAAILREERDQIESLVDLARKVANYRIGQHHLEPTINPLEMRLPETQSTRMVARLLRLDAMVRSQDSDLDGALDSCGAILGVSRSIGDEPTTISMWVRAANGHIALISARRVLAQGEPSEEALARFQKAVLDELAEPHLLQAVRSSRAEMTGIISRLRSGKLPVAGVSQMIGPSMGPGFWWGSSKPWGLLTYDNHSRLALEWLNQLIAIAKGPAEQRASRFKAWESTFLKVKEDRLQVFVSTIPLLMMPPVMAAPEASFRYESELGATAIVLAAERQRRKLGEWPKSIEAISKEFLPHVPIDLHSGAPLVYEFREGELLVHSIGPNLKDEHGAFDPEVYSRRISDDVGLGVWDVSLRKKPARATSAPEVGEAEGPSLEQKGPVDGQDQ